MQWILDMGPSLPVGEILYWMAGMFNLRKILIAILIFKNLNKAGEIRSVPIFLIDSIGYILLGNNIYKTCLLLHSEMISLL